jgi:adenine deaminase
VTVRAIGAESLLSDERRYELSVVDGLVPADVECDVLKVAMFDRYARRSVPAVAFMQGFRLRRGAIGTTYNPYFNNVMVLGTNDEDMAVAANAVAEGGGGFAVVDGGKVRAHLALPLFGFLSDGPLDDFVAAMERLHEEARDLGCAIEWPFHTLAFTAVGGELPRLKLSGLGLFDVTERRLLDTIVD